MAFLKLDFCEPTDPADAARLERITIIMWVLADEMVDLDDFESVIRVLYARGFTSRDIMPFVEEAIVIAREHQARINQ